ncbi:MAG TPA: DUF2878 domain-containing protein [Marinagarivorans sp.]
MWFLIANALGFQAMWLIAVIFGDSLTLVAVLLLVLINFFLLYIVYQARFSWRNEVLTIAVCLAIGFFVEWVNLQLGVWSTSVSHALPPLWLLAIWVAFATSLHGSLAFLQDRLVLAAFAGLIFSPLSYFAGAKLSPNYALADPYKSLVIVGVIWFFVMPLLAVLAAKISPLKVGAVRAGDSACARSIQPQLAEVASSDVHKKIPNEDKPSV